MAYVKIWVHVVWGVKYREEVLTKDIRKTLFQHIKENAIGKEVLLDCVNGYTDHVHCLVRLKADQSIAKVVQLLKGEASFWANKNELVKGKLRWADEYFAVSVNESMIQTVRKYIYEQEEHHQKVKFEEEYEKFMQRYGFREKDI